MSTGFSGTQCSLHLEVVGCHSMNFRNALPPPAMQVERLQCQSHGNGLAPCKEEGSLQGVQGDAPKSTRRVYIKIPWSLSWWPGCIATRWARSRINLRFPGAFKPRLSNERTHLQTERLVLHYPSSKAQRWVLHFVEGVASVAGPCNARRRGLAEESPRWSRTADGFRPPKRGQQGRSQASPQAVEEAFLQLSPAWGCAHLQLQLLDNEAHPDSRAPFLAPASVFCQGLFVGLFWCCLLVLQLHPNWIWEWRGMPQPLPLTLPWPGEKGPRAKFAIPSGPCHRQWRKVSAGHLGLNHHWCWWVGQAWLAMHTRHSLPGPMLWSKDCYFFGPESWVGHLLGLLSNPELGTVQGWLSIPELGTFWACSLILSWAPSKVGSLFLSWAPSGLAL